MDNQEIQHLILQAKEGNKQAFSKLVEYFQPKIFGVTFRMLCNDDDAKDAVQDTFIKAWMQLKTYRNDYQFSTWLYKIATNICLDKLKSSERKLSVKISETNNFELTNDIDTENELINKDLAEKIRNITNTLSPKQKMLFTLRYLEGLEIDEIVQITGLSAVKIKNNLYLARQNVSELLKPTMILYK